MRIRIGCLIGITAAMLTAAPVAEAAFPGQNGKLVFTRDYAVWSVNPDGTGETQLTFPGPGPRDLGPRWSPDGTKIAFYREEIRSGRLDAQLWIMNADGSDQTRIELGPCPASACWPERPAWSPDGTEITWANYGHCDPGGLYIANADGSDVARTACDFGGILEPAWSPDGEVIAYAAGVGEDIELYLTLADRNSQSDTTQITFHPGTEHRDPDWSPGGDRLVVTWESWEDDFHQRLITMGYDGSGRTVLRQDAKAGAWSPDGERIAFTARTAPPTIRTIDPDGSNESAVITTGNDPDWQPIPVNTYARPKEARKLSTSLVPAYETCTTPNRTHGPPLAAGSCHPPNPASDHASLGSGGHGSVRLTWVGELPIDLGNGDQADLKMRVQIADVRDELGLTDYTGALRVSAKRRITDRDNTPHPGGPGAATVQDGTFGFTVPCAPTAAASVGSTCALETTADALVAGAVKERQRAIWALEEIEVRDGGTDGDPDTADGDALFLRQGIFVP